MKQSQLNALVTKLARQRESLDKTIQELVNAGAVIRPKVKKVVPPSPAPIEWKTPIQGTRLAKCAELYNQLHEQGRGVVIKALIEQVGLTQAAANTYYQNCRELKNRNLI